MAQTEADKTFTQARTSEGTRGPVMVGSSKKKKRKSTATSSLAAEQASLREAQETAAIEQIRRAEQEALLGLQRQEAEIAPRFTEARRATTAGAEQAGRRFRAGIAGQGLSGAAAEAAIRQTGALQRDIGGLRQQEAEQFADIARTRADIGRQAEGQIAQTRAQIQAQSIADLINLRQQEQARELQIAGLTGQFRGAPTLAGQQAQLQQQRFGLEEAQAADLARQRALQLQEAETQQLVAANQADLQAAINNLLAQGVPATDPRIGRLRAARQQKILGQEALQREIASEESALERQRQLDEFNRQIALREISERERAGASTRATAAAQRANIQSQIAARNKPQAVKLPSGFQQEVERRADALAEAATIYRRDGSVVFAPSAEELQQINRQAEQETRVMFGLPNQVMSESDLDAAIRNLK